MELEKLKSEWQIHSRQRGEKLRVSESSLEKLLEDKSKNIKGRVTRRMSYDALFMVIIIVISIAVLYYLNLQASNLGALIILTTGFILFIHYHFTSLLLNRSFKDRSVREQVSHSVRILRRYLLLYQWITPVLFGVITLIAWRLNVFSLVGLSTSESSFLIQILTSISVTGITWLILHLIIRWSFHKELKSLQEIMSELDNNL